MTSYAMISSTIVAPLAGAWIEISDPLRSCRGPVNVAPLAGAWIEIVVAVVCVG